MDNLQQILQVANAIIVLAGFVGALLAIPWLRKHFADRGSPEAVGAKLEQALAATEARLRQEMSNAISNSSAHSIQQYGSISTQLSDVKRAMEGATERANAAHDRAVEALHLADKAEDKIEALDRLLTSRLNNIDSTMKGIEELLRHQSSRATGRAG